MSATRPPKKRVLPVQQLYVVRKYIMAKSASDAIRKEKTCQVDDVWLDEDSKRMVLGSSAIGFDSVDIEALEE